MKSPPLPSPAPPPVTSTAFCLLLILLQSTTSSAAAVVAPSPPHISPTAAPKGSSSPSPTASPAAPSPRAPAAPSSKSTLDPKQLTALQSLNIPTARDPCTQQPETATCDAGTPFRHLVSLRLANCSADSVALSFTALKSLSTLSSFSFLDCPVSPIRLPSDLALNLRSFSAVRSLRHLTGVWLSRLVNLTDLTVSDVPVNASGPYVILGNLKYLTSVTVSRTNLTGSLPKHWHPNLTHIDFSGNLLKGRIPNPLTVLENLHYLNLSSNQLDGEIPEEIGDLISLKNLSLSSNSLTGAVPESMSAIPGLVSVDLSSNQLNGTVPRFFAGMKSLKYLNLANNNFHGVMPFNQSFIDKLAVFKIGQNSGLCYNHSTFPAKVKLGIAPCDKHGLPLSPPPAKGDTSAGDGSPDSSDYDDTGDSSSGGDHHHGPSKIVLGVAIALASIVFLIVFLVLLSKCCK